MDWKPIPMNTGFKSTTTNEYDEILMKRVQAIMSMFLEKAIILGARYMQAANRTTLTSLDMLYALQYQAKYFIDDIEKNVNLENNLKAFENSESESESEDETDSELTEYSDSDSDSDDDFTRADDTDTVISEMNRVHDTWSEWCPSNRIQQLVKESIDSTYSSI